MKATKKIETASFPAAGDPVTALRRFHLGAPDAPAGGAPEGAVPVAFPVGTGAAEEACAPALCLLGEVIDETQRAARRGFVREARELAARAEALLQVERLKGDEGRSPELLDGALGAAGGRFLDPAALSGVLGRPRRPAALDEDRASRLREAAEILREAAEEVEGPCPVLVHDGSLPGPTEGCEKNGWTALESSDPCAVAAEVFDKHAARTARVLLAARRVRLEAAGDYDPARHDLLLEGGLDWQAFTRDELALVRPIVALESAHELALRGLVSLSRLLLSGRPVHVLLMDDPTASPGAESPAAGLRGFRVQPAYLGLAQREAYVHQGSTSQPELLSAGFRRAAGLARAALHVVQAPTSPVPPADAVAARAHPLFRYDPEAGTSWADRMDFTGNPEPAEDWPTGEIEVEGEGSLAVAATFADLCLRVPELAEQFLPVPEEVPAEALATVPEWLALDAEAALERVPYVLARLPGERRPVRLAVSRLLALACRDRVGYWRTLQELAGVRSEYVRRAEARVREEAEARLAEERERLAVRHAEELERVRRRAVEEVVNRLTEAVLGVSPAASESPLAELVGADVDDVSEDLLGMVSDLDVETETADGHGSEAVEQVMAELSGLLGPIDSEDAETRGRGQAPPLHAPVVPDATEGLEEGRHAPVVPDATEGLEEGRHAPVAPDAAKGVGEGLAPSRAGGAEMTRSHEP